MSASPTPAERHAMLETLVSEHFQDHITGILGDSGPKLDRFLDDCIALTATYPGGAAAYLATARRLLSDSKEGANPYLQFTPKVPEGHRLQFGTPEWDAMEEAGLANAATACFVLVAGGLGERLGYNGIKVALPHETATGKCYLQCYVEMIQALQAEARRRSPDQTGLKLPLFIMTSGDTHDLTMRLLEEHANFGLDADQLDVVMQELVPALQDSDARMVVDPDTGALDKKPHGHGDVHITLHTSGVAARWLAQGRRTMVFFQDTNGMVVHALPAFLGATVEGGFAMNSLTVPRRPREAVGAICNLEHLEDPEKKSLTINVE
jgi:UDP-sugar pyrophosphorylase